MSEPIHSFDKDRTNSILWMSQCFSYSDISNSSPKINVKNKAEKTIKGLPTVELVEQRLRQTSILGNLFDTINLC